jgi:phage terminase large subunit
MAEYLIPYKPNKVQALIHRNLKRFSVVVLHRGAGKSYLAVNELIRRAIECPVDDGALFMYVAPEKQQAKDIIWAKLKYFVKDIKELKIREDELTVTFPHNNATIRIEGADRPDRLRGIHPHFVVLDEVGQMKRDTWYEAVFPSIQRNNGSVLFIGTPKGDNLFKELFDLGRYLNDSGQDDRWYTTLQNVYQTGVYSHDWAKQNKPLMPEAKWNQEYMCDWNAVFTGAYYADILTDDGKGIITDVPYNPMYPVITGWDLGIKDPTCIWFAQKIENKVYFIDYFESTDKDIFSIINMINSKPYLYDYHIVPHDITQRNYIDIKSTRLSILQNAFGVGKVVVARKAANVNDDISIVSANLHISRFDKRKCATGLKGLMTYRAAVDKLTGEATDKPSHDSSDAADALRTFFVGMKKRSSPSDFATRWTEMNNKNEAQTDYDYFNWGG